MTFRTSLMALTAVSGLLLLGACNSADDEPVITTPPPATTAATTPPTPEAQESSAAPSPTISSTAIAGDAGLQGCKTIIDNVAASKLPLPVNEDAQYYLDFKRKFTGSKYKDVKDAGEDFVDKYASAIKAGGENPDANDLSDAAQDLVKACQKHM